MSNDNRRDRWANNINSAYMAVLVFMLLHFTVTVVPQMVEHHNAHLRLEAMLQTTCALVDKVCEMKK